MERPVSIVRFEQFYLGSTAITIMSAVGNYLFNPAIGVVFALLGFGLVALMTGFSILIGLLLCYAAGRRRSVVAKWLITLFFLLGLTGVVSGTIGHRLALVTPIQFVVTIINYSLQLFAVICLFRKDARAWFSRETR
ncbi:MAG: hypothetical protein K2W86_12475 [Sphingomonas sp.]|uniref:hypothetical protein n=1 Tax=Sphingomonas sp. TaxID=28214 RepID=UPI0035A956BF|nr:hypothetical protein [Sphingomonas sp.]